jgi:hypothetical protein
MKNIKYGLIALTAMVGIAVSAPALVTYAAPVDEIRGGVTAAGGAGEPTLGARFEDIVNIMLYVIGAVAVIMIIIGAIRYTTSNGESSQISSAKNTILYAVIGLVVAIMAYAIVNFVLSSF